MANRNRKMGMHSSSPWLQIPSRRPTIAHSPTIRYVTLIRMNAHPPTNLARNISERDTGLLSNRLSEPGSNICGMIGAVTRMAANTPTKPTSNPITVGSTSCSIICLTRFSLNRIGGEILPPK